MVLITAMLLVVAYVLVELVAFVLTVTIAKYVRLIAKLNFEGVAKNAEGVKRIEKYTKIVQRLFAFLMLRVQPLLIRVKNNR